MCGLGEDVEGGDAEQLDGGGVGHDVGEFYGHIINRRRCMTQNHTWDSVPRNRVVRCSLEGTVVGQTQKWALNGCSNSNELDARQVQPHQIPK